MKMIALIPARSGSKGVKNKNILCLNEKPLIAYSIEAALKVKGFDRVIVTTDSSEIASLARKWGAETPFLRPSEFATDQAQDRDYLIHALDWFKANENNEPDSIAILRPTTPLRDPKLLTESLIHFSKFSNQATSLRSVHALSEPPQKMLQFNDEWLTGFFPSDPREEYFNLPRQAFPTAYQPNGYIDIVKTNYLRSVEQGIFGPNILGFTTPFTVEIDGLNDVDYLRFLIERQKCHNTV